MKPNILFIIVDGLRSDKCHGQNKTSLTPNLDSLISNAFFLEILLAVLTELVPV